MKEEFINAVIVKMGSTLTPQQLYDMRMALNEELADYELIIAPCKEKRTTQANEELMISFISAKRVEGCSEKTLAYYESTIKLLLASISTELNKVTTNDVRCYLAEFQAKNGSSKVTIDNIRRIFSSFFSWLEDEDYIVKSPVRRIHKVRSEITVKEVISDEHLEKLRDCCHEARDLAMIDFLASTGIRVGELVKINRKDIDFQERQCIVLGKGNKERTVYFNARAKVHLQNYLALRTDDNPALFVTLSRPHARLTISGVEVRLRELGKKAEVCRIHPHKFRRTLATMAIDKGMPIEQVQRLLGHCKIDTTLHYAMVNQNNVKNAHRKFIN
jgi:site-specific recombinase XerD